MNSELIRVFITIILVFVSLLLAVFLLTVKTNNKLSNQLMATYFIVFAIHISVFFYGPYIEIPYALDMMRNQIMLLASPLLFLYILSCIYSDFKLKPKHVLHLTPLILEVILFMPNFYLVSSEKQKIFYDNFYDHLEPNISMGYGILISVIYIVFIFKELRKYKTLLYENYAQTTNYNYKWLYQLAIVTSLVFTFAIFKSIYKLVAPEIEILNIIRVILTLLLLGFLCWIVLKSLYNPDLFRGISSQHQLVQNIIKTEKIIKSTPESNDIKTLRDFMTTERPFLNPSISIQILANDLKMDSKKLSILINHKIGQHFFDFINEYRIEKAKQILSEPKKNNLTILEILYDVGFNSKSSFNTAFKKHTKTTPTLYRKQTQSQ